MIGLRSRVERRSRQDDLSLRFEHLIETFSCSLGGAWAFHANVALGEEAEFSDELVVSAIAPRQGGVCSTTVEALLDQNIPFEQDEFDFAFEPALARVGC
jgi:hypothetical protein